MFRRSRQRRTLRRLATRAARAAAPEISNARAELERVAAASREELSTLGLPSRPRCPSCGAPLVLRTAHRKPWDGAQFWGCSTYPRCTYIGQLEKFPDASIVALERRR